MRLLLSFSLLLSILSLNSCEKCKRCSYSYTTTDIVQTVNGEQEVVTTHTDYIKVDGANFDDECVKGKTEFTIENAYSTKGDTTTLANYTYTCVDL